VMWFSHSPQLLLGGLLREGEVGHLNLHPRPTHQ
jgi:hypothetical protein